jgi:protocatechuate 3,4-dioxygenase beta subunit
LINTSSYFIIKYKKRMRRKEFLLKSIAAMGGAMAIPFLPACKKEGAGTGACVTSPAETAGPFPTKSPNSFVVMDIKGDRTGVAMTMKLTIQNVNDGCNALAGALVDVWHCDKDGNYSEYGSQTSAHYLRGRQTTDSSGVVTYKTIFPGWYPGRAPHIHVEIFNASGKSLLITQIAFPTDVCDTVYGTATNFYVKGKQDTSNTRDNIFSDSLSNELGILTGSVSSGYKLEHTIKVKA